MSAQFAKRLRRLVLSTGMNLTEFSGWVNVPHHTLRGWASGRSEPRGLTEVRALRESDGLTWAQAISAYGDRKGVRQLMNIRRLTGCTWEELLGDGDQEG